MNAADRRALLNEANEASVETRTVLGLDEIAPLDIYKVSQMMGLKVRFLDVSMEGFYQRSKPPRILLSAHRPIGRKAFTCAHEVGHHVFGHGSTMDELQQDERAQSDQPNEVLANGFAGFMLMPPLGIRRAFATRGWKADTATPEQILTVATEFGVGYGTLLPHLHRALRQLSKDSYTALEKHTPQSIRRSLLEDFSLKGLAIVDENSLNEAVELEMEHGLLIPENAVVQGVALGAVGLDDGGRQLFRAMRRGTASILIENHKIEARVWPTRYVGMAAHRYLEDPDD